MASCSYVEREGSGSTPGPISVVAVLNGEDVPARVLEPGDLDRPTDVDVTLTGQSRKVIVLESDAFGLQVLHGPVDVVDFPESRRPFVRPGELGAVDDERGAAAAERHGLVPHFADLLEPQRLLVELLRACQVLDREHRLNLCITQHLWP